MPAPKKYPDELRERALRLYRDSEPKPTFLRLGEQLRVHHEALRNWARQAEVDRGDRGDGPGTDLVTENAWLAIESKHHEECGPRPVIRPRLKIVGSSALHAK